jgi:hypothetical protein
VRAERRLVAAVRDNEGADVEAVVVVDVVAVVALLVASPSPQRSDRSSNRGCGVAVARAIVALLGVGLVDTVAADAEVALRETGAAEVALRQAIDQVRR